MQQHLHLCDSTPSMFRFVGAQVRFTAAVLTEPTPTRTRPQFFSPLPLPFRRLCLPLPIFYVQLKELTIRKSLKLDMHKRAPSIGGAMLVVGNDGSVDPADPEKLKIEALSASVKSLVVSEDLTCRGNTEIGGKVSIAGAVLAEGEVKLSAGLDAQGTKVANARLESARFEGTVLGDVDFEGAVRFGALRKKGTAPGTILVVGGDGELSVSGGLELDETEGVLVVEKVSGHEVRFPLCGILFGAPRTRKVLCGSNVVVHEE